MSAVVAGVGRTRFVRRSGATETALAAQAIVAALRDAGLRPADVDGLVRFDREATWEYDLPGVLGIPALRFYTALPFGPGSAPALVGMAAMAIEAGLASTVLCFHARNGTQRGEAPPAFEAALIARRLGIAERTIAAATIAHRRAAVGNRQAVVRSTLTAAERKRSPYVAEPFRRVDVASPSAGACAFVVTGLDRAPRGVRVLGWMQAAIPSATRQLPEWFARRPLAAVRRGARAMFRAARVRSAEVDVACLHADLSALASLAASTYGVARARVNPHGGQLCEAALDGVNDVAAAVGALRDARRRARVALVAGSLLEPTSALLLGAPVSP